MKQYLVRDTNEIFGIYSEISHAYTTLLQYVYLTLKNSSKNCSIEKMLESFQIMEFDSNVVENIYNLGNDFYLYDFNKKIYVCDKISIRDYITKMNKIVSEGTMNKIDSEYIDDKDLDIFIPMTEVEGIENKSREQNELQAKLQMLQNIKKLETDKLDIIKSNAQKDQQIIDKEKDKELYIEQLRSNDRKRMEEKKKKFLVDINVFMRLEKEIESGKRKKDNIPELFINEWKVFLLMRENNIFSQSTDEKFDFYIKHHKQDNDSGNFSSFFSQPSIDELKKLEFSDTDSDTSTDSDSDTTYDDEYEKEEDVNIEENLKEMQDAINESIY